MYRTSETTILIDCPGCGGDKLICYPVGINRNDGSVIEHCYPCGCVEEGTPGAMEVEIEPITLEDLDEIANEGA